MKLLIIGFLFINHKNTMTELIKAKLYKVHCISFIKVKINLQTN